MSPWLLLATLASAGDATPALAGDRISGFGGPHGVSLGEQIVVGPDGGTAITTLSARATADRLTVDLALPFAAYRVPGRRDTDLGNLRLQGLVDLDAPDGLEHALGLSARLNPGGTAWTWATRADEVWPGLGADAVYELRTTDMGDTTLLGRGSLGVHTSPGFDPVPQSWARAVLAGAVDQAVHERVGLVGEASLAWWEVVPAAVTGLVRVDPIDGMRLRAGVVLPLFTWAGWDPVDRPAGAREATLSLQLQAAF